MQEYLSKSHQRTEFPSRDKRREHYDTLAAAYRSLTPEEARGLVDFALDAWARGKSELCEEILLYLTCLTPAGLSGHHSELLERSILLPCEIYRGADAASRDALLALFPDAEQEEAQAPPNLLMGALAWIGDRVVQQRFAEWQTDPPRWAGEVATEPSLFAQVAGWELELPAGRRDLCEPKCFQLISPKVGTALANQPVGANVPRVDICAWCGDWLATLLDIHCLAPELGHMAELGERLRVIFCRNCTAHEPSFAEVSPDGQAHWSAHNQPPAEPPGHHRAPFPEGRLVLGPRRATPYEAHVLVLSDGLSQLGGYPSWEHDAAYPSCPSCERTMPFVGQVDVSDLGADQEGIYYGFICIECRLTATTFQTR